MNGPEQLNFFLCFGLPKSGTTFLQRTLNSHPDISCPSEQSFSELSRSLYKTIDAYDHLLQTIDNRTGGQGVSLQKRVIHRETLRSIIMSLGKSFAAGKRVFGLNDNHVFEATELYDQLLDQPRMIAIVRNPVDRAISAWVHNKRMANLEPRNVDMHLGAVRAAGTLENWVLSGTSYYIEHSERFLNYIESRNNFCVVRYESLDENRGPEIRRILDFLGASTEPHVVDRVVAASAREAMVRDARFPAFFTESTRLPEAATVGRGIRHRVLGEARYVLERLGYNYAELCDSTG